MGCGKYCQDAGPIELGTTQSYYANRPKTITQNLDRTPIEHLLGREQIQYNHLHYQRKPAINPQSQQQSALEMLAYSAIANNHAQASLSRPSNAQNYIAANENQTITLTEGYIKELKLGYLSLTVAKGEEKQSYQLLIRYDKRKERRIEAEKEIAGEIEKLSKRFGKKDEVDQKDIIETLTATLRRRKLRLELTEEEIHLIERTKESKELQKRIWLIDKKKRSFKRLEIEREIQNVKQQRTYKTPTTTLNYSKNDNYTGRIERARNDFTNLVPAKDVHKFPISLMGGVLGFTYIGDSFVGIRDDLNDYESHEVEIHEAIHTPDEYETRVITKWMLDDNTHYH